MDGPTRGGTTGAIGARAMGEQTKPGLVESLNLEECGELGTHASLRQDGLPSSIHTRNMSRVDQSHSLITMCVTYVLSISYGTYVRILAYLIPRYGPMYIRIRLND